MLIEISLQGLILIFIALVMIFLKFKRTNAEHFYYALAVGLILFLIINFIVGFSSENLLIYLLASLSLFLIIFLIGILIAKLTSGKSLNDIQSSAMVFLAPLILYIILTLALIIIKLIF